MRETSNRRLHARPKSEIDRQQPCVQNQGDDLLDECHVRDEWCPLLGFGPFAIRAPQVLSVDLKPKDGLYSNWSNSARFIESIQGSTQGEHSVYTGFGD